MNIVILLFTCFCVLYSAAVLIYLTRKKKRGSQNSEGRTIGNTNANQADPRQSNTLKSSMINRRPNGYTQRGSYRPSHFTNSAKYNQAKLKPFGEKHPKKARNSGRFEHDLGFSQVHLSKPPTKTNGILRNGKNKGRRKFKFIL